MTHFNLESPSGKKSMKGLSGHRRSVSPASNLAATRFLSQSTSNINETNWQEDHRRLTKKESLANENCSGHSGSLLQLPGEEGSVAISAQSESDLTNLNE